MTRVFLASVVCLALGLVVGAWWGKSGAVRDAGSAEVADCRPSRRDSVVQGITGILGSGGGLAAQPQPQTIVVPLPVPLDGSEVVSAAQPAGGPEILEVGSENPEPQANPFDRIAENPAELKAAVTALDARAAQSRAALIEQAGLDDAQVAQVDAAMDQLNVGLTTEVRAFAETVADGAEPDRRDLMVFAANALDSAIVADQKLEEILGAELYDSLDPETVDPLNWIDGSAIEPLLQLGDDQ